MYALPILQPINQSINGLCADAIAAALMFLKVSKLVLVLDEMAVMQMDGLWMKEVSPERT